MRACLSHSSSLSMCVSKRGRSSTWANQSHVSLTHSASFLNYYHNLLMCLHASGLVSTRRAHCAGGRRVHSLFTQTVYSIAQTPQNHDESQSAEWVRFCCCARCMRTFQYLIKLCDTCVQTFTRVARKTSSYKAHSLFIYPAILYTLTTHARIYIYV